MNWTSMKFREAGLRSSWQAEEIVVSRGDEVIDHLRADEIDRVTLVHADEGDSPGEVCAAIFEFSDRVVLLGAASGIGGRVLFERQAYWSRRNCIYWVGQRYVTWPEIAGESRWRFARQLPQYLQLTPTAASLLFERSQASGPHTWDQRKQFRVERRRPFPGRVVGAAHAHGRALT